MKGELHPRNRHQGRYDFTELQSVCPELKSFVKPNHAGVDSIDFAHPEAVKTLNRALLKQYYGIEQWDIPQGYLCPPIPGRADYVHSIADLIAMNGKIPTGSNVRGLDIGVGANAIYPIIGLKEYGWSFVGSDVDAGAFESAQKIVEANQLGIELRFQKNSKNIFKGIIQPGEYFDFTMSNPPFHSSEAEANAINQRKWRNLGKAAVANFGGRNHELWCEGGEVAFVSRMIQESVEFKSQCGWFTSFVSKSESLNPLYDLLRQCKVEMWKTIEMSQGQKKSRFVAWTFDRSHR